MNEVKDLKDFIDYFDKLLEKKRIVILKDHMRDKEAPEFVRQYYWSGNLSAKFNSEHARKKRIRATQSRLGSLNRRLVIVYRQGDEAYIESLEKKHAELKGQLKAIKEYQKEIEEKIMRLI